MAFFARREENNLKIFMETQKTQIAKAIFREKNGGAGIRLLGFRLCYEARVTVQWLGVHFAMQGMCGQSLVEELESHVPKSNCACALQLLSPHTAAKDAT